MSIAKVKPTNPGNSQPYNGPFDSEGFNQEMALMRRDIAELTNAVNSILDIVNALPMDTTGSGKDARNGLDADAMYTDKDAEFDTTPRSMHRYLLRTDQSGSDPATVRETIDRLIADMIQQSRSITSASSQVQSGSSSPPISVDVSTINNNLQRLYNSVFRNGSSLMVGDPSRVFSKSIEELVLAGTSSLETRVGTLETTVASLSGKQTDVSKSDTVNDNKNLSVTSTNLEDEMNELRTLINLNVGTSGSFKVPVARTLQDPSLHQHTSFTGDGSQTTKNPHALEVQTKWDAGEIATSSELTALSNDFDMMYRSHACTKKVWYNASGKIHLVRYYSSTGDYGTGGTILYEEAREYYSSGQWNGYLKKVTIVWDSTTWITNITYSGTPGGSYTTTEVTTRQ